MSADSDHFLSIFLQKAPSSSSSSPSSSSSQWSSSVAVSLGRPASQEVGHRSSSSSSRASGDHAGTSSQGGPVRPGRGSPGFSRPSSASPPQAPVARSELNVRLPRGTSQTNSMSIFIPISLIYCSPYSLKQPRSASIWELLCDHSV